MKKYRYIKEQYNKDNNWCFINFYAYSEPHKDWILEKFYDTRCSDWSYMDEYYEENGIRAGIRLEWEYEEITEEEMFLEFL